MTQINTPHTQEDLEKALVTLSSLTTKCEKAQVKLTQGSSQYTLLSNRIKALHLALSLITKELEFHNKL